MQIIILHCAVLHRIKYPVNFFPLSLNTAVLHSGVEYYAEIHAVPAICIPQKTILHWMQITIENYIANIFFIALTEIKLYHPMDGLGVRDGKEITIFAIQNVCSRRIFVFECGNIKFHCNM